MSFLNVKLTTYLPTWVLCKHVIYFVSFIPSKHCNNSAKASMFFNVSSNFFISLYLWFKSKLIRPSSNSLHFSCFHMIAMTSLNLLSALRISFNILIWILPLVNPCANDIKLSFILSKCVWQFSETFAIFSSTN